MNTLTSKIKAFAVIGTDGDLEWIEGVYDTFEALSKAWFRKADHAQFDPQTRVYQWNVETDRFGARS